MFFTVNHDETQPEAKKADVFQNTIANHYLYARDKYLIYNWQSHFGALESKDQMKTTEKFIKNDKLYPRNTRWKADIEYK